MNRQSRKKKCEKNDDALGIQHHWLFQMLLSYFLLPQITYSSFVVAVLESSLLAVWFFLLQKDCSNTVYGVGHKFLFLANLTANYIALTSPKVHQKKETCSAVVASLHFETHKLFSFLLIKELFVHCKCQGETNFCPATKTLNHSLSKRLLSGLSLTIITKGCLHTSMKMGS